MALAKDIDSASLGAVLKTALDGVVVMRLDGTVAGWNDVAERTFGWSFADARDRRMSELIIPERYRTAHEAGLAHYLATGEGPVLDKHIEIEALHRDGHEIPIELSITCTEQFAEPVLLGFLRDISERRDAERRQQLMIGELNHRVKNLLGVVGGIAHQTVRASDSLADFGPAFMGRLASLGRAHEILTSAQWERASLGALAAALFSPQTDGPAPRLRYGGPEIMLPPRHLLSISMVLHELLVNAIKYGALSCEGGYIDVRWDEADAEIRLDWVEQGCPIAAPPTHQGFGTRMIAMSVRHELRGASTAQWRDDGLSFRLAFPDPSR